MPSALHRWVRHLVNFPALPALIWKNIRLLFAPKRSAPVPPIRERRSVPTEYFEKIYAQDPDPWKYRTSTYERDKYAATIEALPEPRFQRGFDIGCSNGVLTQKLASRCDQLLAIDTVESALAQARTICADAPHVTFARMRIPNEWPETGFDLIMISEVLYYLDPSDIRRTASACLRSLEAEGAIVLVHYLPPNKRPCYADEAVTLFCTELSHKCVPVLGRREALYRLDVLRAIR